MKKVIVYLLLTVAVSCQLSPKAIQFGSDACHYCSMTIVDKQHASEVVTNKGKVFKFDSIECMMNHLRVAEGEAPAMYLVNDFSQPAELIDATMATYLVSKQIPSPMGEYLSAFGSDEVARQTQSEYRGELLTWEELCVQFKVLP